MMSYNSIEDIDKRIKEIDDERDHLLKQKNSLKQMAFPKRMAILLHTRCRSNHTDQCSWSYETKDGIHDWSGSSHQRYLEKAEKFISKCRQNGFISEGEIIKIFNLSKGL